MKKYCLLFIVCLSGTFYTFSQSINWNWAKSAFGNNNDAVSGIATDVRGNLYMVGQFLGGAIAFDGLILSDSIGGVFIAKYDPSGNLLLLKSIGDIDNINVFGIAVDPLGNICILGSFVFDTAVFGNTILHNTGAENIFVAKYDSAGNVLWAKSAAGDSWDEGSAIATDSSGNIYVTGNFEGASIVFGGFTLSQPILTGGNGPVPYDFYLAKYSPTGQVLWAQTAAVPIDTLASCEVTAIAFDINNNVIVTGRFGTNFITLGNLTLFKRNSSDFSNIFTAKYDPSGNAMWIEGAGGNSVNNSNAITTDSSGNVYITGLFISDTIHFGPYQLFNATPGVNNENTDFFLTKYNSSGEVLWTKGTGGVGSEVGTSLAPGNNANIYVSGRFSTDEFSYDSISLLPPTMFNNPAFILYLDSNGNELCGTTLGSGGQNILRGTPFGGAYLAGGFVINPFIIGSETLTGSNFENIFASRFNCNLNTGIESITPTFFLQLHPNPFTTQATVQYALPDGLKNATLVICDILGRVRSSYVLNNLNGEITINANNLSSGIYLYSLVVEGRVVVTKKMVVE